MVYGALLNVGCRFFDKRIGQSTTLTGRTIARHMDAYANECITGEYNHVGASIIYGDSVTGDTMIRTDRGSVSVDELFKMINNVAIEGEKEYAIPTSDNDDIKVLGYNAYEDEASMNNISYVMRHKTKKKLYQITTETGKTVTVTEDHSLIIDRDGFTMDVKPGDLREDDLIITV